MPHLSILVVDDDDVDRERVLRILNRSPFDVEATEAASGAEAIDCVKDQVFDFVLLDNRLGDTIGTDLLPELRRESRQACPVIMITGEGDEQLAAQVLRQGAADYVPKRQLSAEVLLHSIRHSLEQQRLRDELAKAHLRLEQHVREQEQAIEVAQARANELAAFNEAVIQSSPVGIAVYRADGQCMLANAALAQAFCLSHGRVLQQNFRSLAWWRESGLLREAEATLADGQPRRREARAGTGPEEGTWLECSLAPIDHQGERRLLLIAHDVGVQRAAKAELASARDMARAAAQAKGNFLANMSHEIRTPMNAIVGLSRLALEDELPARTRDFLDKVHGSALALMGILDDVLDYSKIEAGQLRFESVEFDLDDLLQRVTDLFAARVEQKRLEFVFEVEPDVPVRLVGDPLRLSQVLCNLVGNAVKFTEQGEVVVGVALLDAPAGAECRLRFTVQDTGVGIAPESQSGLFDAFTQADSSITRRFGGSGLGLAICRRLVHLMDGEIEVHSSPGGGSQFSFSARLGVASSAPRADDRGTVAGLRVLVVDDNAASRRALAHELEAFGIDTDSAASASAALRHVERAHRHGRAFDVILLDWKMPGVDGLQTMSRLEELALRHGRRPTPVMMMATPFGREALMSEAGQAVPERIIAKPVLRSHLFEALSRMRQGVDPATRSGSRPTLEAVRRRAGPLSGRRVLLAEDNPVNQLVAVELLKLLGMDVTVAADGAQAVECVGQAGTGAAAGFDVVLMDLHMPRMDGFEAARRIHLMPHARQLPVIAMSAAVLSADRAQTFAAGMVDHVAKPILAERLVDVLLKWVGGGNDAGRT
ncbi:MAG TPA: response regulator [Albitalea sp.]